MCSVWASGLAPGNNAFSLLADLVILLVIPPDVSGRGGFMAACCLRVLTPMEPALPGDCNRRCALASTGKKKRRRKRRRRRRRRRRKRRRKRGRRTRGNLN